MSLRDIARRLVESFDRACCDACDAQAVRQVLLSDGWIGGFRCADCLVRGARGVDFGRELQVTRSWIETRVERHQAVGHGGLGCRPASVRMPRQIRRTLTARSHR